MSERQEHKKRYNLRLQYIAEFNKWLYNEAADAIEELSRGLDSYKRSAKEWAEEAYRAYRKYSESIFGSPKEEA